MPGNGIATGENAGVIQNDWMGDNGIIHEMSAVFLYKQTQAGRAKIFRLIAIGSNENGDYSANMRNSLRDALEMYAA